MATKFVKGAREGMVQGILRVAFEPKFDALASKLAGAWLRKIAEAHPVWVRLRADPETKGYVEAYHKRPHIEIGGREVHLRKPTYSGALLEYDKPHLPDSMNCRASLLISAEPAPSGFNYAFKDEATRDEYVKLWTDYNAAYATLLETFKRYQSHEALAKDFPEYADYLPAKPASASVPMLAPEQIRAQLTRLGVPKEEPTA